MTNLCNRKMYMKKIYFNAAKSLMDNCFNYMKQYTNYKSINKICFDMHQSPAPATLYLKDYYGAFVTALCKKLCNEIFCNYYSITVFDSHYNENIVCQLYIPDRKISVINVACDTYICKAYNLYSIMDTKCDLNNSLIAIDFFRKAYK